MGNSRLVENHEGQVYLFFLSVFALSSFCGWYNTGGRRRCSWASNQSTPIERFISATLYCSLATSHIAHEMRESGRTRPSSIDTGVETVVAADKSEKSATSNAQSMASTLACSAATVSASCATAASTKSVSAQEPEPVVVVPAAVVPGQAVVLVALVVLAAAVLLPPAVVLAAAVLLPPAVVLAAPVVAAVLLPPEPWHQDPAHEVQLSLDSSQ